MADEGQMWIAKVHIFSFLLKVQSYCVAFQKDILICSLPKNAINATQMPSKQSNFYRIIHSAVVGEKKSVQAV